MNTVATKTGSMLTAMIAQPPPIEKLRIEQNPYEEFNDFSDLFENLSFENIAIK